MQEQRDNAHAILRKAFEDAGIVDCFFCGVFIDGVDVSAFKVGRDNKTEYSNVERYHRLLGVVESCKYSLLVKAHEEMEGLCGQ